MTNGDPNAVCRYVDAPNIVPGWGCCCCRVYNGLQRHYCRNCHHVRCKPLAKDNDTGRSFETYEEAAMAPALFRHR